MSDEDDTYDVPPPRPSFGIGVEAPPPLAPKKLSNRDSIKFKEGLSRAQADDRPKPMPRKNMLRRQSDSGDGIITPDSSYEPSPGSKPVPKPRPRTMSVKGFPSPVASPETRSNDEFVIPPSADEVEAMVNAMILKEQEEEERNAMYQCPNGTLTPFKGTSQSPYDLGNELQQGVLSTDIDEDIYQNDYACDDIYENKDAIRKVSESQTVRQVGDGSQREESDPTDDYATIWKMDPKFEANTAVEFDPFSVPSSSTKPGLPPMPPSALLKPTVIWGGSLDSTAKAAKSGPSDLSGTSETSGSNPGLMAENYEEDEESYEALWDTGKAKAAGIVKPDGNMMKFVPKPGAHLAQPVYGERSGEYVGLDPTYNIPPPAEPPPPLPADHMVRSRPPSIPPRPAYRQPSPNPAVDAFVFQEANSSHLSESSTDGFSTPMMQSQPASVFESLPTPGFSPPFQDDPFKYSDFDFQCRILNDTQSDVASIGGATASSASNEESIYEIEAGNGDFVHEWPSQSTGSASTWPKPEGEFDDTYNEINDPPYGKPILEGGSGNAVRLSQVPPPPPRNRKHRGAGAEASSQSASAVTDRSHYSFAKPDAEEDQETQSIGSSDSSEDLMNGDPHQTQRMSGTPGITFIGAVTPRKTERYGYLYKQGGVKANQGWRLRWVVFNGTDLRYYDNNRSQISKKIIPLTSMKEVISDIKEGDTNRFKFRLVTTLRNRTFLFAADTRDDCLLWTNLLMAAILKDKASQPPVIDEKPKPDKEGFITFEDSRKKYFVAIWDKTMCYYDSFEDFEMNCPVHEIDMKLASVKDKKRNKLQLSTHYAHFSLVLESPQESQSWRMAIEDAIAEGLADDSVLEKVYENDSNRVCADCEDTNPHWASINLGIVLCKKCAGIHRMFELSVSKIRSLRMDTRVWTPSLIELMKAIGNANANLFWEQDLMPCQKPTKDAMPDQRKQFAQLKYQKRHYSDQHPLSSEKSKLNEALLQAANEGNLLGAMRIIFSGAELSYKGGPHRENAYETAKRQGHRLLMELLYQNGGDCSSSDGGNEDSEGRLREDVRLQGYLSKTGPAGRTFDQRWCVLEHGALTYYQNEKSTTAKDSIDRKTIYALQESTSDRMENVFEISTSKGGNRIYTFAAENSNDRGMWMRTLGKLIAPVAVMEHVGMMDFSLASLVYMRESISEEWRPTWIMLCWRVLHYMSRDLVLEFLDLRKATQIRMQDHQHGACTMCVEKGGCIVLMAPGKTFYIQANLQRDTKTIFDNVSAQMKKSGSLLHEQQLTAENVPVIVDRCLHCITNRGAQEMGIYRKAATNSKVDNLLKELKTDAYAVRLDDLDVHEVANALKRFLRELDDSLFTQERYSEWIRTATIDDPNNKFLWYQYLLEKLPLVNYHTLRAIILHIAQMAQHEAVSKMTLENLCTCFAPTLMDKKNDNASTFQMRDQSLQIVVLTDLVACKDRLFQIDKKEWEKEAKIKAATEKINQLHREKSTNSTVNANFLMPVSMYDCNGQSEMVSTTPATVAGEVVDYLCKKCNLLGHDFALAEILFKGTLVRPLFPKHNILVETGRWGDWDEEARKQACLCLTLTDTLEKLDSHYDMSNALFGELKYADSKSKTKFKKTTVEFRQCVLAFYRDSKARNQLCSWKVEDLIIYLGIDPKRNPPTNYGFTFLVNSRDDRSRSTAFGHCVSLASEVDMYKWVSALLIAQNPEGLLVWKNR